MRKKTSLKDIAQTVGVSTALVSYVLNNQKEGRISKTVAQKIRDTAKLLNYSTNQVARSLKTNKTLTIGLIVSDISNPFSSALARIIEDEAEKHQYTVIFCSSDEQPDRSSRLIEVLLNRQVDGIIIAPVQNSELQVRELVKNEVPFVLLDRYFPEIEASHVAIDNYKAAYSSVEHLVQNGNSRIGLVTFNSTLFTLQERKRGYINALIDHGLPADIYRIKEVDISRHPHEIENALQELCCSRDKVEGVLFASNVLSTAGLKFINRNQIKVPDELAIVSFDESDASSIFYAPLTHIKQPLQEMGRQVTQILLETINNNKTFTRLNLEAELIIGKSSLR